VAAPPRRGHRRDDRADPRSPARVGDPLCLYRPEQRPELRHTSTYYPVKEEGLSVELVKEIPICENLFVAILNDAESLHHVRVDPGSDLARERLAYQAHVVPCDDPRPETDRHFDRLDDPLARRHWESRNAKLRVGKSSKLGVLLHCVGQAEAQACPFSLERLLRQERRDDRRRRRRRRRRQDLGRLEPFAGRARARAPDRAPSSLASGRPAQKSSRACRGRARPGRSSSPGRRRPRRRSRRGRAAGVLRAGRPRAP
jgi:hypothetical protein